MGESCVFDFYMMDQTYTPQIIQQKPLNFDGLFFHKEYQRLKVDEEHANDEKAMISQLPFFKSLQSEKLGKFNICNLKLIRKFYYFRKTLLNADDIHSSLNLNVSMSIQRNLFHQHIVISAPT